LVERHLVRVDVAHEYVELLPTDIQHRQVFEHGLPAGQPGVLGQSAEVQVDEELVAGLVFERESLL
jgi:hypothetical protein